MPVIKSPVPESKNETIQLRVSQDIKFRLARYAEFIHATPSYVVVEMLERLFKKDIEFQSYLASYKAPTPTETPERKKLSPAKDQSNECERSVD